MTRIAAGVLVLGAVLAMTGMFPQRLAAAEAPSVAVLRAAQQRAILHPTSG